MRMKNCLYPALVGAACAGLMACGPAHASLSRNAAGAKNIGEAGRLTIDTAGQLERDPDGKVLALETGVQYQVSKRLQFLVEAIHHESHRPDSGKRVSGLGDTDVTLSWLASGRARSLPSIVLGGKVKLPTANQAEIGTGKADYSALLILNKEFGELELDLETEFASFGQAGGHELKDQFRYTFTAEYAVNNFLAVYGELFGNSAPTASESRMDAARGGVELDIPLGKLAAPYISLDIDTERVGTARAGVEWTW